MVLGLATAGLILAGAVAFTPWQTHAAPGIRVVEVHQER